VIAEHSPDHLVYNAGYLGVARTDDVVFIQVTLSAGRSREQKQAFYKRVAERLSETAGIRPGDVTIHLIENTREDWSFGNGEAQYVILPKEEWK
jgi:4-oxalocrotonate tautomerase